MRDGRALRTGECGARRSRAWDALLHGGERYRKDGAKGLTPISR